MTSFLSERVLVLFALLVAAAALFSTTFGTEYRLLGAVQSPVFFPRIILGLMMGLLAVAIAQELVAPTSVPPVEKWLSLIVFVLAALLFANAITRVGFLLAAVPFSAVALPVFGIRNPAVIAAYALVVPGAIVVLFNHVLKLPLPTAPFTYLF